jgi:hypothetical protein
VVKRQAAQLADREEVGAGRHRLDAGRDVVPEGGTGANKEAATPGRLWEEDGGAPVAGGGAAPASTGGGLRQ